MSDPFWKVWGARSTEQAIRSSRTMRGEASGAEFGFGDEVVGLTVEEVDSLEEEEYEDEGGRRGGRSVEGVVVAVVAVDGVAG